MRICFSWHFDKAEDVFPNWRDGLRGAIEELEREHTVEWVLGIKDPPEGFDAYLVWEDSHSPILTRLRESGALTGLFLTTNPHNVDNIRGLTAVFCESQPVYDEVRRHGIRSIKAFGTDTDVFTPDAAFPKDIGFFYPATFSPWKRQSAIAHLGKDLLCVGTLQPDGILELDACTKQGVVTKIGYFPVKEIRDYYRRANAVTIPAIHGSERTVLEAMATDILPRVNMQNEKAYSYIREYMDSGIKSPRQFILSRYSHKHYAAAIKRGLGI